jgi:signal transduction histidine kinase
MSRFAAERERFGGEETALRHVATLVATGAPADEIFATVAEAVGRVVPTADVALVGRYEGDAVAFVGGWSRHGDPRFVGQRVSLGGDNVATRVFDAGRPARIDHLPADAMPATELAREWARAAAGAPINVEGRLWGVITVGSVQPSGLPAGVEQRLADFTELVATAIANADAREALRRVADAQAALRRVATLVARAAAPPELFEAVAREVGQLLDADAGLLRYDAGRTATVVGGWNRGGDGLAVGTRIPLGGDNAATFVFETGRPARIDRYGADDLSAATTLARQSGGRSGVGAPISVDGRLWGVAIVIMPQEERPPAETEARLTEFAELVAMAIANAEARTELHRVANEQAALRRVATLIAGGGAPVEVFRTVTKEIASILEADASIIVRRDPDGAGTVVARFGAHPADMPEGSRWRLEPPLALGTALQTGRPARHDDYRESAGAFADVIRRMKIRSSIATPILVGGALWGALGIGTTAQQFPPESEQRMVDFTELIATAIANAEAQAELAASRARIVASADEARRRIERDLHDGAQQRLITLALQLRMAQGDVPAGLDQLAAELGDVASGLDHALEELRELAGGIHPPVLAQGGLRSALKVLARRSLVPVDLQVRTARRLPEPVEIGAYYVVSEALTNAAKHARAASVTVEVEEIDDALCVRVSDDGVGGADFTGGSGLIGLRDRVEALGGRIALQSAPGSGTSLSVLLPISGSVAGGAPRSDT